MIRCSHAYLFMTFFGGQPCHPYIFLECSGAGLLVFGVRFIILYLSVHTIFCNESTVHHETLSYARIYGPFLPVTWRYRGPYWIWSTE